MEDAAADAGGDSTSTSTSINTSTTTASSLPVIDLSDPDTGATAARLRAACMDQGFFVVVGHGVDPALMEAALAQCRALFALPLEEKLALRPEPADASRGYSPYQSELLNPQEQRQPCTQEGFRLKLTTGQGPEGDAAAWAAHPWPDPGALPAFRATVVTYHEAMERLAYRVTQLLLEAVGLDRDYLHDAFHPCSATTRLLHYPPVRSDPERGILGCGSHTDWGCITLLLSDDEGGLEVKRRSDGAWIPAPSGNAELLAAAAAGGEGKGGRPLICNLGDMLQRWTADVLRSTPHRVVNRAGRDRYSIPFFFAPRPDALVSCLPPFQTAGEEDKYPPILVRDYIAAKYRGITEPAAAAAAAKEEASPM